VKIFDRVMVTSLLTEGGVQGAKVVGATGLNNRTGEFLIFKAKASVLATAGDWSLGLLNTELAGYNTFRSRTATGDGVAMAWKAGAELTMMERTGILMLGRVTSIPGTVGQGMPVMRIYNWWMPTVKNCPGRYRVGRTAAQWHPRGGA